MPCSALKQDKSNDLNKQITDGEDSVSGSILFLAEAELVIDPDLREHSQTRLIELGHNEETQKRRKDNRAAASFDVVIVALHIEAT